MSETLNVTFTIGGIVPKPVYDELCIMLEELEPDDSEGIYQSGTKEPAWEHKWIFSERTNDLSYLGIEEFCVKHGISYYHHTQRLSGGTDIEVWKPGMLDKKMFYSNSVMDFCLSRDEIMRLSTNIPSAEKIALYLDSFLIDDLEIIDAPPASITRDDYTMVNESGDAIAKNVSVKDNGDTITIAGITHRKSDVKVSDDRKEIMVEELRILLVLDYVG